MNNDKQIFLEKLKQIKELENKEPKLNNIPVVLKTTTEPNANNGPKVTGVTIEPKLNNIPEVLEVKKVEPVSKKTSKDKKKIAKMLGIIALSATLLGSGIHFISKNKPSSIVNDGQKYTSSNSKLDDILRGNEYSYFNTRAYPKEIYSNPKTKEELLTTLYTLADSGFEYFTFNTNTQEEKDFLVSLINFGITKDEYGSIVKQYPHTFNSRSTLEKIEIQDSYNFTIRLHKKYQPEYIRAIKTTVDNIYDALYDQNKSIQENITIIHDYILATTEYDYEFENSNELTKYNHESITAYAPLFNGKSVCEGYTDLMSLFLDKMGVENSKILVGDHIWNIVKIDGIWLNLDLTANEYYQNIGKEDLKHIVFLVTDEELEVLKQQNYISKNKTKSINI